MGRLNHCSPKNRPVQWSSRLARRAIGSAKARMNHQRLESRPRIVAISAGSRTQHPDRLLQRVCRFPARWHGWSARRYRSGLFGRWPRQGSQGERGIRLGPHAAREDGQPPPSDLLIGPEGDHIGPVAENHVEVVRHHRERRDLHAEEPGQRLQAVPNPGSAMIVGVAREGIDPAEEGPAHDPLNTVINPDLIRDHDLRAIPPCHVRMLYIGSRCLGPVGRRPTPAS